MKEDRYEFPVSEWEYKCDGTQAKPDAQHIILTRKKPKVKVEYDYHRATLPKGGDCYYLVQFRVTGYSWERDCEALGHTMDSDCRQSRYVTWRNPENPPRIDIGLDARDKFSCPVLLPEEVYSRLPEICSALEQKANQGGAVSCPGAFRTRGYRDYQGPGRSCERGKGMNNDDGVQQKRPDGTWGPAVPLPYPPTWIERVKKFLGLPTWETRKESKPMSETIEERAARICKRLDYIDAWNAGGEEAIELIDDLMAERGKMKERITKAQGELLLLSESTDNMGHPVISRQLMDIHDILSAYTPEEK